MTPLMQQYHTIKGQYADALVLFQVGDFYELFYRDAEIAAAFLGITLTSRGKVNGVPIPLCGVPCHTLDHYIVKLVHGGFRIVICNQQGEVVPGKLVERVVAHVITPGTLTDEHLLNPTQTSIVVALALHGSSLALVYVEMITGVFRATVIDEKQRYLVDAELARLAPQEIIRDAVSVDPRLDAVLALHGAVLHRVAAVASRDDAYLLWSSTHIMKSEHHLMTASPALAEAVCAMYSYLHVHAGHALAYMRPMSLYNPDETLIIDAISQKSLGIVEDPHDAKSRYTLLTTLDHAATAMGSRSIRRWLLRPLCHAQALQQRHDAVELLFQHTALRENLFALLQSIGDYERIIGRIAIDRATPRDYRVLRDVLPYIIQCGELVQATTLATYISTQLSSREVIAQLQGYLLNALNDQEPSDWLIREGFDAQLDAMRTLSEQSEEALVSLEEQERSSTRITSLKIKYITMYGYTFEVTRSQRSQVPAHYELVHSLSNHDRFTTKDLRARAAEIDYARKYATTRERELFVKVTQEVRRHTTLLRTIADELATLDGILGFSVAAVRHNYVRPVMSEHREFLLQEGRHPVVEVALSHKGISFIANDMHLRDAQRIWLITGPNMGGKSTFLRQAALAIVMAHAGSFVAARQAIIPRSDRLFTRIGASDNVPHGKSTFFMEMEDVARICTAATARSFVIIDELGRGTGTRDGIALARAIIEYLDGTVQLLGLCATHYHTLATSLGAERSLGVYHAAISKTPKGIVFLHSIKQGHATSSFGLEVARCAGLPQAIVARAQELVDDAQGQREEVGDRVQTEGSEAAPVDSICRCTEIQEYDLDTLSPRQVYQLVESLQKQATKI